MDTVPDTVCWLAGAVMSTALPATGIGVGVTTTSGTAITAWRCPITDFGAGSRTIEKAGTAKQLMAAIENRSTKERPFISLNLGCGIKTLKRDWLPNSAQRSQQQTYAKQRFDMEF
jgi:hypothetical protein